MPTTNNVYGYTYGEGVKYLKVNRFDSGGLDRSGYLGQLTNLTIDYSDLGPITYNIITVQEQADYFIYGIQTKNQNTSSIDYVVKDFNLNVGKSTVFTISPLSTVSVTTFDSIVNNPVNAFNASTGTYTFLSTPNIPISGTIQAEIKRSSGFVDYDSNLNVILTGSNISEVIGSIDLSSLTTSYLPYTSSFRINPNRTSFIGIETNLDPIETYQIVIQGQTVAGTTATVSIQNLRLKFSQSIASVTPDSNLVIFNPEFIDWDYSDYNPLFGNADIPEYSSTYMDVDYGTGIFTPINFQLILSGTADKAPVQDSNYSSKAWSNIRYNGIKSEAPDFNKLTTNGGYGALPNVEQNETYVAYFDGVGGTGPEIIDQTAYFIKYIIDDQGNIVNPEPGTTALYNLLDSYEPGKNALVRLINNDPLLTSNVNDNSLIGIHNITAVGRISLLATTETSSNINSYSKVINFYSPGSTDVQNLAFKGHSYALGNTYSPLGNKLPNDGVWWEMLVNVGDIDNVAHIDPDTYYPSGVGIYHFDGTSSLDAQTQVGIKYKGIFQRTTNIPTTLQISIVLLPNGTGTWSPNSNALTTQILNFTSNDINETQTIEIDTGLRSFNANDQIKVYGRVQNGSDVFLKDGPYDSVTNYYWVYQDPISNNEPIAGLTYVSSSYWTLYNAGDWGPAWTPALEIPSGSSLLKGSSALTNAYNNGLTLGIISILNSQSAAFGFSNPQDPFVIKKGDWIRFEYDKNKVYNITDVFLDSSINAPGYPNSLYVRLFPEVPQGTQINHFTLYRIVNDGTYVILDVKKMQGGNSFTGIIQPEYVSQTMKDNYNGIIQDLTQKNLIQ